MTQREKTAGRVAFLARREVILAELAKGWSISAVYRQFAPHLPIGLRQFQIYVQRYLVEGALPRFVTGADTVQAPPMRPATVKVDEASGALVAPPVVSRPASRPTARDLY